MPQTAGAGSKNRAHQERDRYHCYDPSNNLARRRERNGKEHSSQPPPGQRCEMPCEPDGSSCEDIIAKQLWKIVPAEQTTDYVPFSEDRVEKADPKRQPSRDGQQDRHDARLFPSHFSHETPAFLSRSESPIRVTSTGSSVVN